MNQAQSGKVIVDANVQDFFRNLVDNAVHEHNVDASDETVHYVVSMLTNFTRADHLYEWTPQGMTLAPLAMIYAEALDAPSIDQRYQALRRLGDVALFMSGMFSRSLKRKVVDVDYYISMGGNAYGSLSDVTRNTTRWQALSDIFRELASRFSEFVEVLGEVSDEARLGTDSDLLRLYELWTRTGSQRAARRLRQAGVFPFPASAGLVQH